MKTYLNLTRQELENIIESDKNFFDYIEGSCLAPDGATVDLIMCAQEQDGDAWDDHELVSFITEACLMYRSYSNRYSKTWNKVIVTVLGGVAEVEKCPDGIEVEIIDHDNIEEKA